MRANLLVNTDVSEVFTGPGSKSVSARAGEGSVSHAFVLCALRLLVLTTLALFNLNNLCFLVLRVCLLTIFKFLLTQSFFADFVGFPNCHMFVFVGFWITCLRYPVESKLCQHDDLGMNCFINLFILGLLVLFSLIKWTNFFIGILDSSRSRFLACFEPRLHAPQKFTRAKHHLRGHSLHPERPCHTCFDACVNTPACRAVRYIRLLMLNCSRSTPPIHPRKNMACKKSLKSMSSLKNNRGILWPHEATSTLIELWGEETIQLSLENAKCSKETREIYRRVKVYYYSIYTKTFIHVIIQSFQFCS
jgi:hypothetical protein